MGKYGKESETLVRERASFRVEIQSRAGHEKPRLKTGGPPSKAKYDKTTDSGKYREGKVKRTGGPE